jgi:hypothetical protein
MTLELAGECRSCRGRRRLIAQITQPSVVTAMLSSLGLSNVALSLPV